MEHITKIAKLDLKLQSWSHACVFVSGNVKNDRAGDDDNAKRLDKQNKGVIFKNCAPFTDCIRRNKQYSNR